MLQAKHGGRSSVEGSFSGVGVFVGVLVWQIVSWVMNTCGIDGGGGVFAEC